MFWFFFVISSEPNGVRFSPPSSPHEISVLQSPICQQSQTLKYTSPDRIYTAGLVNIVSRPIPCSETRRPALTVDGTMTASAFKSLLISFSNTLLIQVPYWQAVIVGDFKRGSLRKEKKNWTNMCCYFFPLVRSRKESASVIILTGLRAAKRVIWLCSNGRLYRCHVDSAFVLIANVCLQSLSWNCRYRNGRYSCYRKWGAVCCRFFLRLSRIGERNSTPWNCFKPPAIASLCSFVV